MGGPGHGTLSLELEIPVKVEFPRSLPLPTYTRTGLSYRKTAEEERGRRPLLAPAASFCRKPVMGHRPLHFPGLFHL